MSVNLQQVQQWINARVGGKCPICGGTSFSFGDLVGVDVVTTGTLASLPENAAGKDA